jgi:3-carboxy-cis,cis-muconate cycloisomerase
VIYEVCHDPASQGKDLAELLLQRKDVTDIMSETEIRRLTDPANYLGLAQVMVDRLLAVPNA